MSGATTLAMTVSGLVTGTNYTCWVVSVITPAPANAFGESECSIPVSVTPYRIYPPTLSLAAPLASNARTATFAFGAPPQGLGTPDLTGFRVFCQTSDDAANCRNPNAVRVVMAEASGTVNVVATASDLQTGTSYTCWAVSTIALAPGAAPGVSECSDPVTVTAYVQYPPPSATFPSRLVAGASRITLSIGAPNDNFGLKLGSPPLTGYRVYCQTSNNAADCQNPYAPGAVIGESRGIQGVQVTVDGLVPGTTYTCWTVTTIAPLDGESGCGASVTVTPFVLASPNIVGSSALTGTCDQTVTFTIVPTPSPAPVSGYAVYCKLAGQGYFGSPGAPYPSGQGPDGQPRIAWSIGPILDSSNPSDCNSFNVSAFGARVGSTTAGPNALTVQVSGLLPSITDSSGRAASNNYYHNCWPVAIVDNVSTDSNGKSVQGQSACTAAPARIVTPFYQQYRGQLLEPGGAGIGTYSPAPEVGFRRLLQKNQAVLPLCSYAGSAFEGGTCTDTDCASLYCQYAGGPLACNSNALRTRCWTKQQPLTGCDCDSDCTLGQCARLEGDSSFPLVCCPPGRYTDMFNSRYYCYGMPAGALCYSNKMCASKDCGGNCLGFCQGRCV